MHVLDLNGPFTWQRIDCNPVGFGPSIRNRCGFFVIENKQNLVSNEYYVHVYCGNYLSAAQDIFLNDHWKGIIASNSAKNEKMQVAWQQVKNNIAIKRGHFSQVVFNGELFIFGGECDRKRFSEMYKVLLQ